VEIFSRRCRDKQVLKKIAVASGDRMEVVV
jgi:hypothetical protein